MLPLEPGPVACPYRQGAAQPTCRPNTQLKL